MIRIFTAAVLSAALSDGVLAQVPVDPNRFVPASALFTMRIQAPVTWKETFAKTKVAAALGSGKLAPGLAELRRTWDAAVDEADGKGMPREVAAKLANEYRGEVVVTFCARDVVDAVLAAGEDEDVEVDGAVMIAMTPDGSFDLGALLAGFRAMDEKLDLQMTEMQIGEHRFRHVSFDGDQGQTQAELVDGHLVMFVGNAIEELAPAMLANKDRATRNEPRAPLSMHVDLGWLVDAFAAGASQGADLPLEAVRPLIEVLGFGALRSVDVRVSALGERLSCEAELHMDGEPGLFGALLGDGGTSALLRSVPPRADSFSIGRFDVAALWRVLQNVLDSLGEEAPVSISDIEAGFLRTHGVRLREDLLDHLGAETLVLGDARGLFELVAEQEGRQGVPDMNRVFAGWCFGMKLRNGKALAESIDKLLRKAGLHAARKIEEYGAHSIHSLRIAGVMVVEYAITDDLLLCVLGNRGEGSAHLRAVLDTLAEKSPALPESVAKWAAALPDGWNGLEVVRILGLVRASMEAGLATRADAPPEVEQRIDLARGILDDLSALGLDELACARYASARSIRWLWLW